jgi:Arc/MetJ-type ribon-helix-helix transcriptional regulator
MYSRGIANNIMSEQLNIRLTKEMQGAIDRVIDGGLYPDRAEFVRDAIREKLEQLKIPIVKAVST